MFNLKYELKEAENYLNEIEKIKKKVTKLSTKLSSIPFHYKKAEEIRDQIIQLNIEAKENMKDLNTLLSYIAI